MTINGQRLFLVLVCTAFLSCVLLSHRSALRLPVVLSFTRDYFSTPENEDSNITAHTCNVSLSHEHTHPIIALASFPGSGNTWIRHLIEKATGVYTGSIYHSGILRSHGFKGEPEDYKLGTTLTVKTHLTFHEPFQSVILLIRDPYKALLAEFNRRRSGKTGNAPSEDFNSSIWYNYVDSGRWELHTTTWLNVSKPILLVKYSDLKENTIPEIERIVKFLGFELTAERRKCVEDDISGAFKRTGQEVSIDELFTPEMHERIDNSLSVVNDMLLDKGYTELEREV